MADRATTSPNELSPRARRHVRASRRPNHTLVDAPLDVVVAGYASIDFVWRTNATPAAGRTALLLGPVEPAPRFGGCAPNVAMELVRLGRTVGLISWLGDDAGGRGYLARLRKAGIDTRGVVVGAGEASPRCLLLYDPAGGTTCCYHPSGSSRQRLDEQSAAVLAEAGALALTVGPASLTEALLDARPGEIHLAWDVKADTDAYPLDVRRRLLREADLICFNRDELAFVLEVLPGAKPTATDPTAGLEAVRAYARAVLVLTLGADGSRVVWEGGEVAVPAERLAIDNPTGAGDAFFAAFLAATLGGARPDDAARAASRHAAAFLRAKARSGDQTPVASGCGIARLRLRARTSSQAGG